MEQFSLNKWLQDKSRKVVTRDGREVDILKTNAVNKNYPIIGTVISNNEEDEEPHYWTIDGKPSVLALKEYNLDLFFADDDELTEFEKMLRYVLECYYGYEVTSKSEIESLKLNAKRLFDLARKELQPEFDKELDKAYKTQDDVVYRNGYAQGKQDALKAALESLPKWKKAIEDKDFDRYVLLFEDEERVAITTELSKGEYYIELDDLKNLPKEE